VADEQHRLVEVVGSRPEQMVLEVTSNVTLGCQVVPGREVNDRAGRHDKSFADASTPYNVLRKGATYVVT